MNCSSCGSDNQSQARYCYRCGAPLAPVVAALPAGTVLQRRYRIERLLGQGGMGAVYLAEHLALGDWVAIKEMREDLLDPGERAQAVAQFQAEARTLARLRHPNLPRVLDHFAENGRWYLVSDYVEGQNLTQIQAAAGGGPLPEAQVLDWAAQLCDVLTYLHGQNAPVIFRDLKPANVMIDDRGRVKLIDFGIARFFRPGKGTDTLKMGTVGYAPPEQYAGRGQTTPRSDLYALGATLHQLLTGSDPTATPFAFAPPRTLNPKLSQRLSQAVIKALSLDPAARFASAAEMKQALLAASGGKGDLLNGWAALRKAIAASLALAMVLALLGLGTVLAYKHLAAEATPTASQSAILPSVTVSTAPPSIFATATEAPAVTSPATTMITATLMPGETTSTPIRSLTLTPTVTLTPTPTATLGPTPSVTLAPDRAPTASPTATASPKPNPRPPAPTLLDPKPDESLSGNRRFVWQWDYGGLAEGQAFDLLICSEEEKDLNWRACRGAVTPWRETWADVDVGGVATVVEHGAGTYYWTVIVVRTEPYERIGQWGELRPFVFQPPALPADTPIPPTETWLPPTRTPPGIPMPSTPVPDATKAPGVAVTPVP